MRKELQFFGKDINILNSRFENTKTFPEIVCCVHTFNIFELKQSYA